MSNPHEDLWRGLLDFTQDPLVTPGMKERPVWNSLLERYGASPSAARERVQEFVRHIVHELGMADDPLDIKRTAENLLIGVLLADGVEIPRSVLAKKGRAGERLNDRQAVCLWLAARHRQSVGLSGLWRYWETLLPDEAPYPSIIRKLFDPPACEGGEQAYLDASHITLIAHIVSRSNKAPVSLLTPVAEVHRRLARMLLAVSLDEPLDVDRQDEQLIAALSTAFDISVSSRHDVTLRALREAALIAASAHGVDVADAGRLLTWIVGSCLEEGPAESILEGQVLNADMRGNVRVDLLKGRTTLQDEIVRRLLEAEENLGDTRAET